MTEPGEEPYAGPPPTRPPDGWRPAPQPGWYPQPPSGWFPPAHPGAWYPAAPPGWHPAPPPAVRWAPPPGTPPHDVPQPFLLAMRARDWAWWRPVLGLLLFGAVYLVLNVIAAVVGLLGFLAAGADLGGLPDLAVTDLTDPRILLFVDVSLIVAIPCVWMVWAVAHGMRIGWSSSVLARLRRRLFLPFTVRALATMGVAIAGSAAVGIVAGDPVSGPVRSFGWLLVVVLLTTPLQSAAEEYVFRGYLSQAIAGWVRAPVAGAVLAGGGDRRPVLRRARADRRPDLPRPVRVRAGGVGGGLADRRPGGLDRAARGEQRAGVRAGRRLGGGAAGEESPGRPACCNSSSRWSRSPHTCCWWRGRGRCCDRSCAPRRRTCGRPAPRPAVPAS